MFDGYPHSDGQKLLEEIGEWCVEVTTLISQPVIGELEVPRFANTLVA